MSKHTITIVEPDQRPDLSAAIDNQEIQVMISNLAESLSEALLNCNLLIGTQVSRDKGLTQIGSDSLKTRKSLTKALMSMNNMIENALEEHDAHYQPTDSKRPQRQVQKG